ncbi:4-carboxymuconolactone decarboxylase [Marinobacterium lacunae]|uniref:4-carboxymuconolactone decarboxylase n=1 Tax=Marinobacterium lacunae TaxID=1232683 RepID=A0A081G4R0_9GAMM|nr:carboxymuconolactone decarboxylase family protein [Marinobacterium lacunae]KEA65765.1 4-carboxymuconolactone decarboxylase [Marinobacterium lacunae]
MTGSTVNPQQAAASLKIDTSAGLGARAFGDIAPRFAQLTDELLFGDIWQRTALTPRERSLVTVAALIALTRVAQQPFHMSKALENGLTDQELAEVITHLAFYCGWPCAASALGSLQEVIASSHCATKRGA